MKSGQHRKSKSGALWTFSITRKADGKTFVSVLDPLIGKLANVSIHVRRTTPTEQTATSMIPFEAMLCHPGGFGNAFRSSPKETISGVPMPWLMTTVVPLFGFPAIE